MRYPKQRSPFTANPAHAPGFTHAQVQAFRQAIAPGTVAGKLLAGTQRNTGLMRKMLEENISREDETVIAFEEYPHYRVTVSDITPGGLNRLIGVDKFRWLTRLEVLSNLTGEWRLLSPSWGETFDDQGDAVFAAYAMLEDYRRRPRSRRE